MSAPATPPLVAKYILLQVVMYYFLVLIWITPSWPLCSAILTSLPLVHH